MTELEVVVREKLDLGHHIQERPMLFLGGALALGFVVGLL